MAEHGLRRGEHGLEIDVMCEIPANVIRAREFAEILDTIAAASRRRGRPAPRLPDLEEMWGESQAEPMRRRPS